MKVVNGERIYELGETPTTPCREYMGGRQKAGYGVTKLDGRFQTIHRWIVEKVEERPLALGEIVMHHCDNPPCFLYEHLKRVTSADNHKDAKLKGRLRYSERKGATHPQVKLTEEDVLRIRSLRGKIPQRDLAKEYGVDQTNISQIQRRVSWRHI